LETGKYRLLVVDVDGTLLGAGVAVSDGNRRALAKAADRGVKVSLSTGRSVQACSPIIKQLSLDGYHIFFDGALVADQDGGEEVYVRPINGDLVRQFIEFVRGQDVNFDFFSATEYFAERETWASDIRRRFFGLEPTITDFAGLWQRERVIKGTVIVRSAEEKARADIVYRHFGGSLNFSWSRTPAYPGVDFINVVAPEVSKGEALAALSSFLGVTLDEVVAIGDGANDISLLSRAGLAIAMDNALGEVKAAADHVTLDVDHDGVAAAVDRFLL